jgi:hypothetical protein
MVAVLKFSLFAAFIIWNESLELGIGSAEGDIINIMYELRFGVTSYKLGDV